MSVGFVALLALSAFHVFLFELLTAGGALDHRYGRGGCSLSGCCFGCWSWSFGRGRFWSGGGTAEKCQGTNCRNVKVLDHNSPIILKRVKK